MKAPFWGLTAIGVVVGTVIGGPAAVVASAIVGASLDWLRAGHREHWFARHPLREEHLRAIRRAAPDAHDEGIQRIAALARSSPPPAAIALQNHFDEHARHRARGDAFWKADATRALVAAFQTAFNADGRVNAHIGRLPMTGLFGPKTAAALTLYTHVSVSPDPEPSASDS